MADMFLSKSDKEAWLRKKELQAAEQKKQDEEEDRKRQEEQTRRLYEVRVSLSLPSTLSRLCFTRSR